MTRGGKNRIPMTGKRFGMLVVIGESGRRGTGEVLWKCRCDCGNETTVSGYSLRKFIVQSCGCLHSHVMSVIKRKHGKIRSPEYKVWAGMKRRCNETSGSDARIYRRRGINVCAMWENNFQAFLNHVGTRPSSRHQLDRINNNVGYEPGNVRWALPSENARNRRGTYLWHVCGVIYGASVDAARANGVSIRTIGNWVNAKNKNDCWKERRYDYDEAIGE